jgi:hypothetical protein
MPIDIVETSAKALQESETKKPGAIVGKVIYPFLQLNTGQSFIVPISEANQKSLYMLCRYHSKHNKRFIMVKHKELNIIEIARIE